MTQTSEQLGKTAGKDLNAEKVTYPSLYGLEESEKMAAHLINVGSTRSTVSGRGRRR